jgi:hypothetical protein
MQGYEVVTSDDDKIGKVVGTNGDYRIVQHGTVFKSKHAVPPQLAHVEEAEQVVRLTVSKEIVNDSPKVGDDFDEGTVAQYYGIGEGYVAPETEGYGELGYETAIGAEVQGRREGVESPGEERAQIRESLRPETQDPARDGPGAQIRPTSGTG